MKIKKHSCFEYRQQCLDLLVHICTMGNEIIYITRNPETGIIQQLSPCLNGILRLNNMPHVWLDQGNWLESKHTQASIHTTHGLNGWKIYKIKQNLFDYWLDRPK